MRIEILKIRTRIGDRLYFPGPHKPEVPEKIARELIAKGSARAWPPVTAEPAAQVSEAEPAATARKQKGGRNRMQTGGHNRSLSSADEDSHTPLSAVGASSGTGRG